ncbi:MAG: hypothetical protein IJL64_04950 [Bacteroidales bacterium]|nr:hypothetical protein [Bacteroidales bacterium]MBQ7213546.1 hypothetical protein [Bacteroidales bacterium]
MNTDIRIDWHAGMEITPQTFIDMENDLGEHRMILRKILATQVFGVVPQSKFVLNYDLSNKDIQIREIECTLMLPSGQVVIAQSEEDLSVPIPDRKDDILYLTVSIGDKTRSYDRGGIPHIAYEYVFDCRTLDEIHDAIPLLKLKNANGRAVDEDFILPVVSARSSLILMEKVDQIKQQIQKILEHESFQKLEDKLLVRLIAGQLLDFRADDSPRMLASRCSKLATVLSYPVFERSADLPEYNLLDIEPFLRRFIGFIGETLTAMDDLKPKPAEVPEPEPVEEVFCPTI